MKSDLVLFASTTGLQRVKTNTFFDVVDSVYTLDENYKCFHDKSKYFINAPKHIDKDIAESIAYHYGSQICPSAPLGFDNGQYLIGFFHNTPDNTLPIFWSDEDSFIPWYPLFKRYQKIYN
ncbi:MAG: hypothetical protein U5L00_05175 [Desulfovermiculus sp.]|nr:hypothetical protein [Desulfovermiculus sp.]